MEDMQNQMNAILSNPEMMQQIMSMAQSLGQQAPAATQKTEEPQPSMPDIDLSTVQRLSKLASRSGIDKNQQALLSALRPFLDPGRVNKLEKAMRAAKMANLASDLLSKAGFQSNPGG